MTDSVLQAMTPASRILFTTDFLSGESRPDFSLYTVPAGLDRLVELTALDGLIDHVMSSDEFSRDPETSDSWLAPRLHAALRLRRSEAADRSIWIWLTVARYPSYVRWRFPGREGSTSSKRFIGGDRDNALSRLWWGAELTRNGADYGQVQRAFQRQDIANTWFALDAFHNRAAALAAMRMLPRLSSKAINRLSNALNHFLTTIMLDAVAPLQGPDIVAIDEWVAGSASMEDLLQGELPPGPLEDPVDTEMIDRVEDLVRRVAAEVGIDLEEVGSEAGQR